MQGGGARSMGKGAVSREQGLRAEGDHIDWCNFYGKPDIDATPEQTIAFVYIILFLSNAYDYVN